MRFSVRTVVSRRTGSLIGKPCSDNRRGKPSVALVVRGLGFDTGKPSISLTKCKIVLLFCSPAQSIKTDSSSPHVVNMKTGGAGQRSFSGQVLLPTSKERMVFRADTAAFQPRAVYATGSAHRR